MATQAPRGQRRNEGWKIPGFARALEVFGKPYVGSTYSESFLILNQDLMAEAILSHSSALADKCSNRPAHDPDDLEKLQLVAEFRDCRDPVRPAHPHQEVKGKGVGDRRSD